MTNATNLLIELQKVARNLGSPVLDEVRALEALPIKIEFKGVVDDLVIKSIYFVPGADGEPPALHIEVEAQGCTFVRIPPDKLRPSGSPCPHQAFNKNLRCAEMSCWNYVGKHRDDPVPQQGHRHGDLIHDHPDGHQRHDHDD